MSLEIPLSVSFAVERAEPASPFEFLLVDKAKFYSGQRVSTYYSAASGRITLAFSFPNAFMRDTARRLMIRAMRGSPAAKFKTEGS
jgi:hypothetical protein